MAGGFGVGDGKGRGMDCCALERDEVLGCWTVKGADGGTETELGLRRR